MSVSPQVNTNRKGGAFPIMLKQSRRAVGVAIVRGGTRHKLGRLHYVRGASYEAPYTCKTNHNDYRYKSSQRGDLAGTLLIPQRDMPYFNSSRVNMTFACLRKSKGLIE